MILCLALLPVAIVPVPGEGGDAHSLEHLIGQKTRHSHECKTSHHFLFFITEEKFRRS